jgi:succinate-semialdehyde dehydrogenase/glutarate-semialdehyde dehydrogenase
VADAAPADGRTALDAAVAAQPAFAATSPRARSDMLTRAFELLHERIDDLALLMTMEMGKPLAEAHGEIAYAADFSATSPARRCGSTAAIRPPPQAVRASWLPGSR